MFCNYDGRSRHCACFPHFSIIYFRHCRTYNDLRRKGNTAGREGGSSMLVFNAINRFSVNPLGGEVYHYLKKEFEKAVVFADIAEYITCLNSEIVKIHARFPRCKSYTARATQIQAKKFAYFVEVTNGTNHCCTMVITVVHKAFYYDANKMKLELADKGFGVIREDK